MSEVYLLDTSTLTVLFEFDVDTMEERSGGVKWTDKPIEEGSNIADYGNVEQEKFRVEGIVTAWPLGLARNPLRVVQAEAALRKARDAKQPLTLVTGWWTADCVISRVSASQGQRDGEKLRIPIELQTFKLVKPVYITIPPSRLKARVKKRATPAPTKGGAAAGKTPPRQKDWIYKLGGLLGVS